MKKLYSLTLLFALFVSLTPLSAQPCRVKQVANKHLLVSTSENLPEVLGYFDNPVDQLPPEFLSLMETFKAVEEGTATFIQANNVAENEIVGPILGNIEYDQGDPYNRLCPILDNGGRSLTGCVATAMAQVLRFYQYPAIGTGVVTYTTSHGAGQYDFSKHPFDWAHMKETYSNNFSPLEGNAVAELMLACGASVNMSYSSSGSGSSLTNARDALKRNFGYTKVGMLEEPNALSDEMIESWGEEMVDQFKLGYPVLFAGIPRSDMGHAFVVDGYKVENGLTYFHVNWGWSGIGNGWFLLTSFNSEQGKPSYASQNVQIIYNIVPPSGAGIDDTTTSATQIDFSLPIYNLLGTRLQPSQLQHGQIYLQRGAKFIY